MSDLIDRHEAIRDIRSMDVCVMYDDMCSTEEAVEKAIVATKRTAIFGLECMPSAEQEIIRCKDCKYWTHIKRTNRYWCKTDDGLFDLNPLPDDFCSRAKRRTDE